MKVAYGSPSIHPTRGMGTRVRVSLENDGGWAGHYEFDTHGLTTKQAADRITATKAMHMKKAARLTGFDSVRGSAFVRAGRNFKIVDCTILHGGDEIDLYVNAREVGSSDAIIGFPFIQRFATVDDVPDNTSIVASVQQRLFQIVDSQQTHSDFLVALTQAVATQAITP